jgi:hypothetical protein
VFSNPGFDDAQLLMPKGQGNVRIRWLLDSSAAAQYEFRRDSFYCKGGNCGQIVSTTPIMGGAGLQVVNSNQDAYYVWYALTVYAKHGSGTCTIDPWIYNVN